MKALVLDRANVDCLRALVALLGVVGDLGPLAQRAVAVALNCTVVDEEVLALVIGRDEAVALLVTEPLDCSGCHALPPRRWGAANAEDAARQTAGATRFTHITLAVGIRW